MKSLGEQSGTLKFISVNITAESIIAFVNSTKKETTKA